MAETLEPPLRMPRVGISIFTYVVTLLGAMAAISYWDLRGLALVVAILVPVAALAWMIVACRAARRDCGPPSVAQRAYTRRFIPLMLGYVLFLFAAVWLGKQYHPTGIGAVVLAILPALPLVGVVWAMGRLILDEEDEYQRSQTIRQFLVATGFMLTVTSVWGFLESSDQVPHLPLYWSFILWCAGLGVGSLFNEFKR